MGSTACDALGRPAGIGQHCPSLPPCIGGAARTIFVRSAPTTSSYPGRASSQRSRDVDRPSAGRLPCCAAAGAGRWRVAGASDPARGRCAELISMLRSVPATGGRMARRANAVAAAPLPLAPSRSLPSQPPLAPLRRSQYPMVVDRGGAADRGLWVSLGSMAAGGTRCSVSLRPRPRHRSRDGCVLAMINAQTAAMGSISPQKQTEQHPTTYR